jgi:uncharacterized protein (TIGR04255 family)
MSQELNVKPAAGKHAIEVMALAVEWARPITADVIANARAVYDATPSLRDFLPRSESLKAIKVQVGNDGPSVSAEPDGLQLSQHRDDGSTSWVLQLQPALLACSCLEYERWDSIKPKALELLSPIMDIAIAQDFPIQAVGLQYQDAFRIETQSPLAAAHRLFREDSPFLNSHMWHMDGPWHIHQGWFSNGLDGRVTHNLLNVDLTIDGGECLVRINGQHRLLTTGQVENTSIPIEAAKISIALDSLHNDNKTVIFRLLSDSVCKQIGLVIKDL